MQQSTLLLSDCVCMRKVLWIMVSGVYFGVFRNHMALCMYNSPDVISSRRDLWSPLMDDDARASLSDWSGSDVRRRLHGGCCLATRLPDHCQLPSVPPTQTLALWITLHEHAQRRECGLWMCDTRPSSSTHPSVSQPAASVSFPWVQEQKQ